ncbi:MAG: 5-formyltetrahydrofolate cyclo-ligase [Candidatus Omnitrophota bacterium]|jgi:5-formyltetrahydrofolate cyclo-ligase
MNAHIQEPVVLKDVALTKQVFRNKILVKLKRQKEEDRVLKSRKIKEKLFSETVFHKAKIVMFYISVVGEVDTTEMIKEAQILGKMVLVPVCWNRTIVACLLDNKAKLQKGPYGIWEPAVKKPIPGESLGLVIVPGLAFNKKGNRLGRGKGYYDRFLSSIPPKVTSIGLAFDFQILPSIPSTPTDVSVDKVIFA